MLAEPHLAEDTFALHLSLQRLEGLIDIVIADENLHAVLLFVSHERLAAGAYGYAKPLPGRIYSNRPFRPRKTAPRDFFPRAPRRVDAIGCYGGRPYVLFDGIANEFIEEGGSDRLLSHRP
jgi:hypothetical protein